jgi:hypothetical protein
MGPAQAPLPCSTGGPCDSPIANSALLAVFPHFGAPLGPACVPQLHAPPRCWCTYSGHLPLGAPTRRVERLDVQQPRVSLSWAATRCHSVPHLAPWVVLWPSRVTWGLTPFRNPRGRPRTHSTGLANEPARALPASRPWCLVPLAGFYCRGGSRASSRANRRGFRPYAAPMAASSSYRRNLRKKKLRPRPAAQRIWLFRKLRH